MVSNIISICPRSAGAAKYTWWQAYTSGDCLGPYSRHKFCIWCLFIVFWPNPGGSLKEAPDLLDMKGTPTSAIFTRFLARNGRHNPNEVHKVKRDPYVVIEIPNLELSPAFIFLHNFAVYAFDHTGSESCAQVRQPLPSPRFVTSL